MNVIPGSRGWATAAEYIATRHGGYEDGPRMTGRSMPSPETATRVACVKENAAQRTDVPFATRTTKLEVRAADQTQYIDPCARLVSRLTVPVRDVTTAGRRTASDPRRAHVP